MSITVFSGVLSAIVTPFSDDGARIDVPCLRELVARNLAEGVHGVVTCGSTGEFASLSNEERRIVVEVVADEVRGRVPVIAQIGAMTTREATALARHAEEAGAEAVMAVAPYYEPLTIDEVGQYFLDIADAVSVPIMIYNLPVATGVNLTPETVVALARKRPNIQYVKDTSGDFSQAATYLHDYREAVTAFVGWDTLYFSALVEGARGAILGAANFLAPELVATHELVVTGQLEEARATWDRIYDVMHFLVTCASYVGAVRAAMDLLGVSAGPARQPMGPLDAVRVIELDRLLRALRT